MPNLDHIPFGSWICAAGHDTDRQPLAVVTDDGQLIFVCSLTCRELIEHEPAAVFAELVAA